jgi:hypothetical protein
LPLDRASSILDGYDPAERLLHLLPKAGSEEVARVLISTQKRLSREEARRPLRPLFLRLDAHLNVRDCDTDTAARLGYTPDELRRLNLRALLNDARSLDTFRQVISRLHAGDTPDLFRCPFHAAAGRTLQSTCMLYAMPDGQFLLIGAAERLP